jgi:hypothetical protein
LLNCFSFNLLGYTEESQVNLMRKVGNFSTCEICNNCSDLLRDGRSSLCQAGREIIIKYRRAHLSQQAAERFHMEQVIEDCKRTGRCGQPTAVFIDPDAMTDHKGNTPVIRAGDTGRSSKKTDSVYNTNRVVGVQVVCGKMNKFFLYILDEYVPKGANCLIEVVRQTLGDLNDYLAENGWYMPRTMYFQADNR